MTISPAETTRDERIGSTLYASIWLIFLAFPVVGLLRSAHGPAAMAVGVGLLLLFAVVYVLSWWEPGALSRLPRIPATLMWLFGLTLCLALLTPLMGGSVLAGGNALPAAEANIGSIMGIGFPPMTGGAAQFMTGYEGPEGTVAKNVLLPASQDPSAPAAKPAETAKPQ